MSFKTDKEQVQGLQRELLQAIFEGKQSVITDPRPHRIKEGPHLLRCLQFEKNKEEKLGKA